MMEPQRSNALRKQVVIRFGLAALLIPVILFVVAGTIHYWQGWLYWMILLLPMLAAAVYFLRTDPELLERRMKYKEKEPEQRTIVLLGTAFLVAGFLTIEIDLRLHGLDQYHLRWCSLLTLACFWATASFFGSLRRIATHHGQSKS